MVQNRYINERLITPMNDYTDCRKKIKRRSKNDKSPLNRAFSLCFRCLARTRTLNKRTKIFCVTITPPDNPILVVQKYGFMVYMSSYLLKSL